MSFFDICNHAGAIPFEASEAVVFDASHIAETLDRVDLGPMVGYTAEDFEVIAPPFIDKYFWIESTTRPSSDPIIGTGEAEDMGYESVEEAKEFSRRYAGRLVERGALCIARNFDTEDKTHNPFKIRHPEVRRRSTFSFDEAKWIIAVQGFVRLEGLSEKYGHPHGVMSLDTTAWMVISKGGYLLSNPKETLCVAASTHPDRAKLAASMVTNMLPFVCFALSFLNKRTEVEWIIPNHQERKNFSRKVLHRRKGSTFLRSYYMLHVAPSRFGNEPITDKSDIRPLYEKATGRRAHRVRGHFRRVGETGLFGKGYHANELIYISDSIRGLSSLGTVSKGYILEDT